MAVKIEIAPGSFVRRIGALRSPQKEMLRAFSEAVQLADKLGLSGVEFVWLRENVSAEQIRSRLTGNVQALTLHAPIWVNYRQTLVEMWHHHWKLQPEFLLFGLAPCVTGFYTEDCEEVAGQLNAHLIFHPGTIRNLKKQGRLTPPSERKCLFLIEPDWDRLQKGQDVYTSDPEQVAALAKETGCEIIFDTSHNGLSKDRLLEDWEYYRQHFVVPVVHFSGWKKPVWEYPKPWTFPPGGLPVTEDLGAPFGMIREFVQELRIDCQTNGFTRTLAIEHSVSTGGPETAHDYVKKTLDFLSVCGLEI